MTRTPRILTATLLAAAPFLALASGCRGRALAPNAADGLRAELVERTRERDEARARAAELETKVAELSPARMEALHGQLWSTGKLEDMELYLRLRKVEPLDRAMEALGVRCWASGVRGGQTDHRQAMEPLALVRQRWSLRPLLDWTAKDVFYYMQEHNLPQHPLFEQGYSTVGDWHSSGPDDGTNSGRATRFGGLKQECGIHLPGVMGEGI